MVGHRGHRTIQISRVRPTGQALAQTPGPYVGPVLFDIVETRSAVRFAVNRPPSPWNIDGSRPQAVLFLSIDQNDEGGTFVIKWIGLHLITPFLKIQFGRPLNGSNEHRGTQISGGAELA